MPVEPRTRKLKITADADETSLSRVCGILALLAIVPQSLHSRRDGDGAAISIEIELTDADPRRVDLLRRKLAQLTLVARVECDGSPDRSSWRR